MMDPLAASFFIHLERETPWVLSDMAHNPDHDLDAVAREWHIDDGNRHLAEWLRRHYESYELPLFDGWETQATQQLVRPLVELLDAMPQAARGPFWDMLFSLPVMSSR